MASEIVQVFHISSDEPLVLLLINIGDNEADLSDWSNSSGKLQWSLWVGLRSCANSTSVKGALAQGTAVG